MDSSKETFNFPSGVQLPFILRKKVQEKRAQAALTAASTTEDNWRQQRQESAKLEFMTTFRDDDRVDFISATAPVPLSADLLDRSFSADDLEKRFWKTSVALVEVQKQIHRGEESYYEETFGHGSLFKGWEGYLDAKDASSSNSGPAASGSRRVPQDFRWFSGSSRVSRTARPPPINTQWTANTAPASRLSTATASASATPAIQRLTPPTVTVTATVPPALAAVPASKSSASTIATMATTTPTPAGTALTSDSTSATVQIAPQPQQQPASQSMGAVTAGATGNANHANQDIPPPSNSNMPSDFSNPNKPSDTTAISSLVHQNQPPTTNNSLLDQKIPKKRKKSDSPTPVVSSPPKASSDQSADADADAIISQNHMTTSMDVEENSKAPATESGDTMSTTTTPKKNRARKRKAGE